MYEKDEILKKYPVFDSEIFKFSIKKFDKEGYKNITLVD